MERRSMWLVPNSPLSPEVFLELARCTASDEPEAPSQLKGVLIDAVVGLAVASNSKHMRLVQLSSTNRISGTFIVGVSAELEDMIKENHNRSLRFVEEEIGFFTVTAMGSEKRVSAPIISGDYPAYRRVVERVKEANIFIASDTNTLSSLFKRSDINTENLVLPKGFSEASNPNRTPEAVIAPIINRPGHQVPLLSLVKTIGNFEGEAIFGYDDQDRDNKGFIYLWFDDSGMDINDDLF